MFETIVVGTDGSPTATKAVARAAELAASTGDKLHIVTAYHPVSMEKLKAERASVPEEFRWNLGADSDATAVLHEATMVAEKAGVSPETHAVPGDPAENILLVAKQQGAGLIVVGSKGIERRIRGSVPYSVVHDADRDVLIVNTT